MDGDKVYKPHVNPPLRFMWIAHFKDGTSLPEFDPFKYERNTFQEVLDNQDNLKKFGIYPIPSKLSKELNKRDIEYTLSIPFLPHYEVELNDYRRVIFYRRNFIHQEQYRRCLKCGNEFHSSEAKKYKNDSPVCPNCGAYDIRECADCNNISEDKKCPKCGSPRSRRKRITSKQYSRERRERETHIGYQDTVKGINKKVILKIDKEGNAELV